MKRNLARKIRQSRKNDFLGIVIAPKPKKVLTPEQIEAQAAKKAATPKKALTPEQIEAQAAKKAKATKKATSFDKLKSDAEKMLNNEPTK